MIKMLALMKNTVGEIIKSPPNNIKDILDIFSDKL